MMNLPFLPALLAQIDPNAAVVAAGGLAGLITAPNGLAALALIIAGFFYWEVRCLNAKHVDLLEKILPISTKLGEAVERLERRLDAMDRKQP